MHKLGIIYIGTNSIKLVLSEIDDNGYFHIIDELTSTVRLCYDLIDGEKITEDRIDETLTTLKSFKSLCSVSGVKEIITVATEVFRLATNKDYIIQKIKTDVDLDIRVLSNEEEIYYNYLGVINSIYFDNSLLVSICGSSTHFVWIVNNQIKESVSIPLGSVNLSYQFNLQNRINKDDLDLAKTIIDNSLASYPWLKEDNFDSIIVVGGTVRTVAKIDRVRKRYPFEITHNYIMNDYDVNDVYNLVKSKDLKLRKSLEGLSFDRADIIVGGTLLLQRIINLVHNSKIIVSGRGLREGLLYEHINNNCKPILDILDYSIYGVLENLNINKSHAEHVYSLTCKLFEGLKPIHKLTNEYDHVIKTASLLHDCGTSIDYYNHHRHSFYIIINAYLNGLTHRELLLSAAVAASHRNNHYHLPMPQFCGLINKLDINVIDKLGVILKLAEGLDRSLEGAVTDLEVIITDEVVTIMVTSDLDLDLEINQALRCANKFNEVYLRTLKIEKK